MITRQKFKSRFNIAGVKLSDVLHTESVTPVLLQL
jgi:hypothetical protein